MINLTTILTPHRPFAPALRALDAVPLNTGFARVVLEGRADGQIWVDRLESPRVMHAIHSYGMSLVWGDAVSEGFNIIVSHLREGRYRSARDEWLQIDPRWQDLEWDRRLGAQTADSAAEDAPCIRHARVNFNFDEQYFRQSEGRFALPDGWRLRPAIAADVQLQGQVVPRHFWRDAQQFLAGGGGWCAEKDGQVGAIAFVSYRWGDEAELGIETMAHARRQGLGSAVAAALIADVLRAGLIPVWSCRMDNLASYALAQQLGFRPQEPRPYYRLRQFINSPL